MSSLNKKRLAIALGVCAAALPVALTAPSRADKAMRAPFVGRNFAHRGLHTRDKSVPENSMKAFRAAADAGYGMELDVQLSRDGQVVVFHDDSLERVCGLPAKVEDLSFQELQTLRLCQTEERIPLLRDVLGAVDRREPIIVELKKGRRNGKLCRRTRDLLRQYGGPVCVESFDPRIVTWFRLFGREFMRGQLAMQAGEYVKEKYPPVVGLILSNTLLNFLARPHFIAYRIGPRPPLVRLSELLGALKFGWTSHDSDSEKGRDAVIFEFYRPKVQYK